MFFSKKTKSALAILIIAFVALVFYPYKKPEPIRYIDRETGKTLTEKTPAAFWLNWLYVNPIGELSLEALIKRKIISEWYGRQMDKPSSAKKIPGFVKDYNIDLSIVEDTNFHTFNDFFIRKLKPEARPVDTDRLTVVSPADGKVLVRSNLSGQDFIIKGVKFNLNGFIQNDSLARTYEEGSILLFRLCPADYHRFHFPVSGKIIKTKKIDGDYYSVSPLAIKKRVGIFCSNKREWTLIKTKRFGNVLMSEIGATMVGSIVQTYDGDTAVKGTEKGYFKFGGSSIVLLFQKGRIKVDSDLVKNSAQNLETTVVYGTHVARCAKVKKQQNFILKAAGK